MPEGDKCPVAPAHECAKVNVATAPWDVALVVSGEAGGGDEIKEKVVHGFVRRDGC